MARRDQPVIEREISRRRTSLLLKCLIAALIFISVVMAVWIIYETKFKEHKNPWTDAGSGILAGGAASGDTVEGSGGNASSQGDDGSGGAGAAAGEKETSLEGSDMV